MPKNRKVTKVNGANVVTRPATKLRIGTRKAGTSAYSMSNEQLQAVLNDKNRKRYHDNARAVLRSRKVTS